MHKLARGTTVATRGLNSPDVTSFADSCFKATLRPPGRCSVPRAMTGHPISLRPARKTNVVVVDGGTQTVDDQPTVLKSAI